MVNCETQAGDDPILLAQQETDALIETVMEQMEERTFNSSDREILKRMIDSFSDSRGLVRLRIAETLGEIGKPATPLLIEALTNHPNVVVRRAAAKTLTLIADPIAIPDLIHALLNDEDTVVKGSSVGALARMGEGAVPPLLEILASPELPESTKGHAAWALAFIGAEAKDLLYQQIDSDSVEVRSAIVGAIAKIAQEQPDERSFDLLVKALTDTAESVRSEAASALGNLTYQPAIPNLIELLHHPDWESRKAAALALMKIGDLAALEPLQTALTQESEAAVQAVIKLAISQIEKKSKEE